MEKIKNKIKDFKNNNLGKTFIVLLFGSGFSSVITLINLMIMIHVIGIKNNGAIIMLQTYVALFTGIFSFKSFESIIKYLSKTIHEKNINKTKQYIKFSFMLDIISIILALICSYLFIGLVFYLMNWPIALKPYLEIYIISILFTATGTATGIIRIYNKFNDMVKINAGLMFIKFIFYVIAFFMRCNFEYFFIIEFIFSILINLSVIIQALYVLKEKKLLDFYKTKLEFDKEYFMFNVYSSLYTTLDIPVQQITTFILNKYLGFSDVGVYNILSKIGAIVIKLESPVSQIIYPEMNNRIVRNEVQSAIMLYKKLFKNVAIIATAFSLVLVATYAIWMPLFIENYNLYWIPFIMYLIYVIYTSASRTIHDLFISLGYIKYNVSILSIVNVIYLIILYFMIFYFKINGVIISLLIQAILVIEVKKYILRKNKYKNLNIH